MSRTKSSSAAAAGSLAEAEAAARTVVKHFFGRAPRRLTHMVAGKTNAVFEAVTGDGIFIIRLSSTPGKLADFMKEQWAAAQAAAVGVPVPEILEAGSSVVPFAYMIQRKTDGTEALTHPGSTREILRQMGAAAARIHTIRTTGFGPTFDWSGNVLSKWDTWKTYVREGLEGEHRLRVLEEHGGLSPAAMQRLRSALRQLENWDGTPSLAHGDLRLKNAIVDDTDTISAVIDWEECHSAPAMLWDFAIALHDLGVDGKQAFLEGYGIAPKAFAEISPLVKTLNILHYAPVLKRIAERKDKERLAMYRLRLSGALDLFSL